MAKDCPTRTCESVCLCIPSEERKEEIREAARKKNRRKK